VLPPLPPSEDVAASPVKPAAAAAEAAADSMLHACESLWSFLRLLNVFLNDVRAGKCDRGLECCGCVGGVDVGCCDDADTRTVKSYGVQDCIMKGVRSALLHPIPPHPPPPTPSRSHSSPSGSCSMPTATVYARCQSPTSQNDRVPCRCCSRS
jgi:hypothetical protein